MHPIAGQSVRRTHTGAMSLGCLLAVALAAGGGRAVAQPISSSALWLRADAITGVANGGAVAAWNDASGNGRNYEQGSATSRPLLYTTDPTYTINNKPVLRFDGSDDFLKGNAASLSALNQVAGASVFAVRKLDALGAQRQIFSQSVGGASFQARLTNLVLADGLYGAAGRSDTAIQSSLAAAGGAATTAAELQAGVARYTQSTAGAVGTYVNGATIATSTTGFNPAQNTPNTNSQWSLIGANGNSTNLSTVNYNFNGNIAEIILYPRALDTAERSVVENYLGAKYALNLSGNATTNGNYNAVNSSFRTDVIGIGKASNNSLATASGLGGLKLDGTLSAANTWLYSGNDGTANSLVTSGSLPAGSAGYWARLWNVAKVGSVAGGDDLSLTFDWAAAGLTSEFNALTDQTTAGFALWSGSGTDVSGFSSLLAQATSVNTFDRTVTFSLDASALSSGDNLTLVVVPEPQGLALAGAGLAAAAWAARRRAAA